MPIIQYDRTGKPRSILSDFDEPDYRLLGQLPCGTWVLTSSSAAAIPSRSAGAAMLAAVEQGVRGRGLRSVCIEWDGSGWWPYGSTRPAVPWGALPVGREG